MKIYVVETMNDYTTQIGFSTDKKVAEREAEQCRKNIHKDFWVTPYTLDKNTWCDFNGE